MFMEHEFIGLNVSKNAKKCNAVFPFSWMQGRPLPGFPCAARITPASKIQSAAKQ
jgi:hypothetical protein